MASISASEAQWSANEKVKLGSKMVPKIVTRNFYILYKRIFGECYHRFMLTKSNVSINYASHDERDVHILS